MIEKARNKPKIKTTRKSHLGMKPPPYAVTNMNQIQQHRHSSKGDKRTTDTIEITESDMQYKYMMFLLIAKLGDV